MEEKERCLVCGAFLAEVDCSTESGWDYMLVCRNKRCKTNKRKTKLNLGRQKMRVVIGKKGLKETWQAEFPKTIKCGNCDGGARHGFTVKEDHHDNPIHGGYVCDLHKNDIGAGGKFWPHDCCAVAVYFCGECGEPSVIFNQR